MTLDQRPDEDYLDALIRQVDEMKAERREENRVRDDDQLRRDLEERDAIESPEAEAARWARVFAARPSWYSRIHYERDSVDRGEVSWPWHGTAS